MPEFALTNKINYAHERIDIIERRINGETTTTREGHLEQIVAAQAERIAKLEGEVRAMKARMGKTKQ